ncbi:dihydrodipicolinate synthase family protein [Pendulispora albinea]|uniref:Dihydrodipicolinate synthase family protein n=1 Tax=Pendulispora albinea TaxID=2741071 RepID=A0ABZ2M8I6_9BACT
MQNLRSGGANARVEFRQNLRAPRTNEMGALTGADPKKNKQDRKEELPKSSRKARVRWRGVIPAVTTPFNADLSVDYGALADQCRWLAERGVSGIAPLGSLGEGATLTHSEKRQILETCVRAVGDRVAVLPGVFALSTPEAVALARHARAVGCGGLMILPPFIYGADAREVQTYVGVVMAATDLRCILYNNPQAYRVDFLPEQVALLAREFPNLEAVRESSPDPQRLTALRAALDSRVEILGGSDSTILEAFAEGAVGWLSGLVSAFPAECLALHRHAVESKVDLDASGEHPMQKLAELHQWFAPLMQLTTGPKVIQHTKLIQERVGRGHSRVRAPRLALEGEELRRALEIIDHAIATRPKLDEAPATVASKEA